jgi:hypothetical protein
MASCLAFRFRSYTTDYSNQEAPDNNYYGSWIKEILNW